MQKLKVYVGGSTQASFGYGDDTANAGIIVPDAFIRTVRDSLVINVNARRSLQVRPQRSYDGAAEHMLLMPAAKIAMSSADPIVYMMQLAKHSSIIAKSVASLGNKMTISAFSQILADLQPSTTIPGVYDVYGTGVGYPIFLRFINELTTNYVARQNVYKTMTSPGFTFKPPVWQSAPITANVINDQLMALQRFGIIGQRIPILGRDSDPLTAARFMCENYMFSHPASNAESDQRLAFAAMYMSYDAIAKSEASYDAAFPVVPPTSNDQALPSSYLNMLAHLTKTALQCASLPTLIDVRIKVRMFTDALEFLQTGPHYAPELIAKANATLATINDMLSSISFGPDSSIASTVVEYLKSLTSGRYLLPEMFRGFKNSSNNLPFDHLPMPSIIDVPVNYPGYMRAAQKVVEFSGMDVPRLIANINDRLSDLKAALIDLKAEFHGLESSFTMGMGAPFNNLDSMVGSSIVDTGLGEFKYTSPTAVSLIPTYIPKYVRDPQTQQQKWILGDRRYSPFFPLGFHYDQITMNCRNIQFAWDSEVSLPSTPSTGSDLAKLLLPHDYVSISLSNSIPNEIGPVGSQLAALPNRPMAAITDWFTPVFQDLATGMVKPDVVANALLGMFTLYRRAFPDEKTPSYNDEFAWQLIDPQIPYVYGYPVKPFTNANAPWSKTFPATVKHAKISDDGQFMLVLHRAIPTPSVVKYIPFTLRGGLRISLPVNAQVLNAALKLAQTQTHEDEKSYYSAVMASVTSYSPSNGLIPVTAWGKAFQFFPHIFFSNKFDSRAATHFQTLGSSTFARHRIAKDDMQYFGYNLQYYNMNIVVMEPNDEAEAYESPSLILDISEDNKGKYKAVAPPSGTPPTAQHIEVTDHSVTHEEEVSSSASTASSGDLANNTTLTPGQTIPGKTVDLSASSASLAVPGDMAPPSDSEIASKAAKDEEDKRKDSKKK